MTRKSMVCVFVVSCLLFVFDSLSCAQEGHYVLGDQEIEFRLVVDVGKDTEVKENWEEMLDIRGDRFLVFKKAELGSQDVETVRIRKSPFGPRERYQISVSFKKESWDKVRNITKRLIGRRLGIVRGNRLISAPVVRTAVDKDAVIGGAVSISDVQWFIAGLVPKEEPREEDREGEYTKWLEQWVRKSPDDLDAMSALAGKYMYGEKKDYGKAATLFEEILLKDPQRTKHLLNLGTCYTRLGEYAKAVRTYERAIVARPEDEWITRWQLAEAYKGQGENPHAIRELEKGLRLLKASSLPDKDALIETFKVEIENLKQP
jgi:hypothetical protein